MSKRSKGRGPDYDLVMEHIRYEPDTGLFYWIKKPWKCRQVQVGNIAGSPNKSGYTIITLRGYQYYGHRLAFLFMGETMPKYVDHVNRVPSDNRWPNLRAVEGWQNSANQEYRGNPRSGYRGVYAYNKGKAYLSTIGHKGRLYKLGVFDDPLEAHEAYQYAARWLRGEYFS